MKKPLMFDLFCGLGGATEGFIAEGWECIGIDIERHDYGSGGYPGQLWLQDIMTVSGAQLRHADFIWASPPCQQYSYRAMPWKRAKALPPPDNSLFEACFRIQREACEAAGRYVPMVVENVRGAQKWVGKAQWRYGSFFLWGDVPALMPVAYGRKVQIQRWSDYGKPDYKPQGFNRTAEKLLGGRKGFAKRFEDTPMAWLSSKSSARKQASAVIAKIPFQLARHIARCYKPEERAA